MGISVVVAQGLTFLHQHTASPPPFFQLILQPLPGNIPKQSRQQWLPAPARLLQPPSAQTGLRLTTESPS